VQHPRLISDRPYRGAEASDSRLWAGIHFRSDLDIGLAQGRQVAAVIIDRARGNGSP
jgi:hypothetical protein